MSTLTDPLQNTCFLDFVKKYFLAPVTRYDQVSYCSSGNRADHLHQTGVVFADNANHTKEKAYVNKKVNLPPFSFEKTLAIALAHCYLVQLKKPNKAENGGIEPLSRNNTTHYYLANSLGSQPQHLPSFK